MSAPKYFYTYIRGNENHVYKTMPEEDSIQIRYKRPLDKSLVEGLIGRYNQAVTLQQIHDAKVDSLEKELAEYKSLVESLENIFNILKNRADKLDEDLERD